MRLGSKQSRIANLSLKLSYNELDILKQLVLDIDIPTLPKYFSLTDYAKLREKLRSSCAVARNMYSVPDHLLAEPSLDYEDILKCK